MLSINARIDPQSTNIQGASLLVDLSGVCEDMRNPKMCTASAHSAEVKPDQC